ncbi:hypothetical protein U1701_13490 [Sphingomonas sp. PB2P19]|uniref:hypothetical protein n=1 Tax=Sphingomonas rhamnosi TaxID=3096156 RepID=UPI002FCB7AB8
MFFLLASCGREQPANSLAQVEAQTRTDAAEEGRILCAQGGATLKRDCTIEQTQSEGGLLLTLRHPDGAFHRLQVTTDGRGVIAADGAEVAKVTVVGTDGIEVALGGGRYRLPATIKGAR